jgi:5-methylcytosine-specific restriction endonuclease McrA
MEDRMSRKKSAYKEKPCGVCETMFMPTGPNASCCSDPCKKIRLITYRKTHQEANKEQIAARTKAHREANKEALAAKQKARYEANKEKYAARSKAWREANKEQIAAREKAYYEANKEGITTKGKAYREANREANKEKYAARSKAWREANKEQFKATQKEWAKAYPEKVKATQHKRRARKAAIPGHFTAAEWEALKAFYNHTCLCCGKREPEVDLQADHIIPVAWGTARGAINYISNIQPLCGSCNARKGNHHATDYRPFWDGQETLYPQMELFDDYNESKAAG